MSTTNGALTPPVAAQEPVVDSPASKRKREDSEPNNQEAGRLSNSSGIQRDILELVKRYRAQ